MAKTFTAPFAQTPKTGTAVVTAAAGNISGDSPTGAVLLATAGADGAILTRLWAMPRGNTTPSSLLLFIQSASDSTNALRIIDSEVMPSYTTSTSVAVPETQFGNYSETTPLRLAAGDKLYAASQVGLASGIVFRAEWTDF